MRRLDFEKLGKSAISSVTACGTAGASEVTGRGADHPFQPLRRATLALVAALSVLSATARPASAATDVAAWLLFDAQSGEVLARENAFQSWQPASVTKLMTTYVILKALRTGRLRSTSPVVMSARASAEPPSKMGFPVGTVMTIDNALKIIMVKSANDVAWALGEAVSGSREAFVAEMNTAAASLGMASTRFVNSNGLPADGQVTNAHDLALLARALLVEFPERSDLYSIPALQFGKNVIPNHNDLLERFPGSDGMKTGFICASGFNVVASASRGGRRLIAVVLGARSARIRAEKAAELMTKGFEGNPLGWLSSRESIYAMQVTPEINKPTGDLKPIVCGRGKANGENGEEAQGADNGQPTETRTTWLSPRQPPGPPVKIWLGGAEILTGSAVVAAPRVAPVKAGAGGIASAGTTAPDPINRSFGLFGADGAPLPITPGGQANATAVQLSPIIEDLPEPPARPKKAKAVKPAATAKAAKPAETPKPTAKSAEAPKKAAEPPKKTAEAPKKKKATE
jgi:D-alanyl-D-alanine carboxypeptidase